jgi:hypothetical protein
MNYPAASHRKSRARRQGKNLLGASGSLLVRGAMSGAWCRDYGRCFSFVLAADSVQAPGIKPILPWIS